MLSFGFILFVTLFRLLPHPANLTPMGAVAVLSGRKMPLGLALATALGAMLLSDMLLSRVYGYPAFSSVSLFVYAAFGLQALISRGLRSFARGHYYAAVLGASSFFVVTNLGVWLSGWYPPTLDGLLTCYTMALPFFQMTLVGDLLWTGILALGLDKLSSLQKPAPLPLASHA